MANRATVRMRTVYRREHPSSKSHIHVKAKRRGGPRISRTRIRMLRDDLNATREVINEAFHKFWIVPESDIRETLAATQRRIGKAAQMLRRAA